jgi:hypothetical protein
VTLPPLPVDVAALYVDVRGRDCPYPNIPGVECWGLPYRDAREYAGPWPVVAHPPCGPYSKLRHLYRGSEHDCAPRAVDQVRAFGGVLEHPKDSKLWDLIALPRPGQPSDQHGGFTVEVDQVDWGHVARKSTWIYLVRVPLGALVKPEPREPTHWVSGFRSAGGRKYPERYKRTGCAVPPGIKVCSAQQRRRTPPDFAEYLVSLARSVERKQAAS